MERSLGFSNPNNITFLSNALGLGQTHYSNMPGMRGRFSEQEYATELRHMQASKWAFKSVAEGIEHFKSGRHTEAFGCLNKALHIDPRNVEGLVARGALYANSGSFVKAIEDFENALKLNQNHQNARKYMGETLVALGRSYEDENKFEEALKSYENCLAIIPFHEEAQNSIEFLKAKISKLGDVDSVLPGISSAKTLDVKESLKHLLKSEEEDNSKKDKDKDRSRSKKKKDRKSRKRRRRSSTSSSSSSSGSSHSSSSSSSSSSESSSGSSHSGSNSPSPSRSRKSKKHKKRGGKKEDKKDKSLSPLSKRMALMDPGRGDSEGLTGLLAQRLSHYNPPALPFAFTRSAAAYPDPDGKASEKDDYEQKVCRFLEQTKGDSEYEEKVRKFLEETARWKKERKAMEEKGGGGGGKKKKRKEKKSKEKGKKKRDHDKKKRHRSKKGDFEEQMDSKKFRDALRKELGVKDDVRKRKGMDDDEEFLYGHGAGDKKDFRLLGLDNLPDLEDLETKLSAYYAKVEKGTGLSKGRNEDRPEKRRHMSPKVVYVHDGNEKEMMHMREKKSSSMDIFADSHSQESKNKFSASEAANLMNSKWKMQIGSVGVKIKKRERSKFDQEPWEDADDKRFDREESAGMDSDEELQKKRKKQLDEKVQARKAAMLEAAEKRSLEKQKKEEKREEAANKAATFMGKFPPGFRSISSKVLDKKDDLPPLPPGMPPKIQFPLRGKSSATVDIAKGLRGDDDDDTDKRKKRGDDDKKKPGQGGKESGGSSHSRSRSRGKYSRASSTSRSRKSGSFERRRTRSGSFVRSRSRSYGRYRSSGSRSRSRSYRSRSRSYNSRSRSRSEDGHYRRRSRSQSDDRRRRDYHMNKYQGRYPRNRGTYYRPRFQNYKNPRGNFVPRGGRNFHPKFMHNNRGRPFIHRGRGRGGGGQGRFFHYKRGQGYNKDYQHRDRRYDRPRSRDSDDRRSYSRDREEEDPMKKVDAAKEKINKYLAEEEKKDNPVPKRSKDDPLSEGEERDEEDYPPLPSGSAPGFVDRKVYEEKA